MLRTLALASSLVGLVFPFGCGGSNPPAEAPKSDETPPADGTSSESSGSAASSDSPPPAEPPAAAGDTGVTCTANTVCTELPFSGKDASDAKDRCTAAGGEARDGACSHDDVAASCAIEAKNITMYFYVNKTAGKEWMRGFLKGGEDACAQAGGTMTRTPAGKASTGKGGKGGKPKGGKPKKK